MPERPCAEDYERVIAQVRGDQRLEAVEKAVESFLRRLAAEIEDLEQSHATKRQCDEARNRFHEEFKRFAFFGLVRMKKREFFSRKAMTSA